MSLFLASLAVFALGGTAALLAGRQGGAVKSRQASLIGLSSCVAGCLLGIIPAVFKIFSKQPEAFFSFGWNLPGGDLALGIDALSGFFLLAIFLLSAIAAVYGLDYLKVQFFDGLLVCLEEHNAPGVQRIE